MKRFILIQVILLSIVGIGCRGASNTNVSANRANTQTSNTVVVTNTNRQAANVTNTQTANVQPTNRQATPNPTPQQTAEKKDEGSFSFPPPRVTDSFVINRQQLLNREGPTTFLNVSQKLEAGLNTAGYPYPKGKYTYYWNNEDEFAIITTMERIDADGTPFTDDDMRWKNSDNLPTARNLSEYVKYLISGKLVYYRVFAFVVTNKNYEFSKGSPPSFNAAKNWTSKIKETELGGSTTAAIREIAFDEQYKCSALLYLFVNHNSLDNPKPIDEGELNENEKGLIYDLNPYAVDHLHRTGINFGGQK